MEPLQSQTATPTPPATSSAGLFGTKIPASAAFLVAILLFLLPFAEVKCNGTALANNTGVGIAMGSEWKEVIQKNIFGNSVDANTATNEQMAQKQDPNIYAIGALALGIVGLLIAVLAPGGGGRINLFVGILAAVSLIAMLIDLRSKVKSDNSIKSSELGINAGVSITVEGTPVFYLTIILFLAAAFFSWQRSKMKIG
jgi:hypothetical protein